MRRRIVQVPVTRNARLVKRAEWASTSICTAEAPRRRRAKIAQIPAASTALVLVACALNVQLAKFFTTALALARATMGSSLQPRSKVNIAACATRRVQRVQAPVRTTARRAPLG